MVDTDYTLYWLGLFKYGSSLLIYLTPTPLLEERGQQDPAQ